MRDRNRIARRAHIAVLANLSPAGFAVLALAGLGACGGGGGASPAAPAAPHVTLQPGDIAITNVSVVPMSRDGVLAHHTIVVRGDRIVAVAPNASLEVPAGTKTIDERSESRGRGPAGSAGGEGARPLVIDGTGKWLMPGLADMHIHLWSDGDLTLFLAAGVTTVRNMFGSEEALAWRAEIARGERLGPTLVTAGPIIDGDPPIWPGSAVIAKPDDAERIVVEQKAKGYDFLKPYSKLSREGYEALVAAAQRHGMVLAGHVPGTVKLAGALAARQKSIEHLDGWLYALLPDDAKIPEDAPNLARLRMALPRLDIGRLPSLIADTIRAGTWNCPTLIVLDRIAALSDLAGIKQRVKWLDKVAPAVVNLWDPKQDFRFKSMTDEDFATLRSANAWRAKVLAALAAARAPLLVGTDTGNPFVIPGESLHEEIELMVEAGVPRAQVMRAATAGAAEYLGAPHDAGVIEVGARADLLLVPVDPLQAPLPLVPDGVMVRGKWLARAELDAKLAEIARRAAIPLPADRWGGVPPLAAEGKVIHQAHYDMALGGNTVGEERVAVGVVDGKRVVVAQSVADFGGRIQVSYRIAPDAVSLAVKSPAGALQLTGKLTGGKLAVTGTDAAGKPLALSAPLPTGGYLSGPGVGGTIVLADRLAGMKVGSLELAYYPTTAIATASYDIERKPDAGGQRVFALTGKVNGNPETAEIVVDREGFVVKHAVTSPMSLVFTRRP
jgi:imidazolonepropionase-like amidohydrolase